jgi:GMP synthase-like glutamine amidotransferase
MRGYHRPVRLLCIHHEPTSDGGTLLAPARTGGWAIAHWHAHSGEPRPLLEGVDAVVAYGGTMNPDDDARLAWLADVRATLAEAVERDTAVLGICLGAQLLGQALGVGAPRLAQPELGWFQVELTPEGADDALLGPLAPACEVFQWHDYGCELPEGAVQLARSERAAQQAYRLGDAVWAIQFHIEVDADSVERWTGAVPELVRARGAEPAELVARARAYEPEYLATAHALMGRFLTIARSRASRPVG